MRFLLKFVETKKYADDVIKGSLYMNALSYFWSVNYGEPLGTTNSDRYDIFEGTYLGLDKDDLGLNKDFANVIGLDPIVRLSAYEYINLFSAYHAEYNVQSRELIVPKGNQMDGFGKFVVVIMDEAKFRRRVHEAAQRLAYDCVFGDVDYHAAVDRGKPVTGNMLHVIMEDEIQINELVSEQNAVRHYDCFDKWDKHAFQREWRICLNRNLAESNPYRLEIGPISDIAFVVPALMLYPALTAWLGNIAAESPLSYLPKHGGTISRQQFKMNVHKLRPNKGFLLITIM